MRIFKTVLATGLVVGGLAAGATAADAATTTSWRIEYTATVAAGTISWGDGRSATVTGSLHAGGGVREVCSWGVNGTDASPVKCTTAAAGTNAPISHGHTIDKVGGVQLIHISLYDGSNHKLGQRGCTRTGCVAE
ncbi:hypothetical protein [Amycolatopsis sp. NPDC004378]